MLRSPSLNSRTASFLNSPVNFLRRRFPMDASRRIVAPRLVSTKPGRVNQDGFVSQLYPSRFLHERDSSYGALTFSPVGLSTFPGQGQLLLFGM